MPFPSGLWVQLLRDGPDGDLIPIEGQFVDTDVRNAIRTGLSDGTTSNAEAAKSMFAEVVLEGLTLPFNQDGEACHFAIGGEGFEYEIFTNIGALSLGLYDLFPEHFAPFFFRARFDQFAEICRSFDISIPPPPGKTQSADRAMYYLALNEALQEFRTRQRFTPRLVHHGRYQ